MFKHKIEIIFLYQTCLRFATIRAIKLRAMSLSPPFIYFVLSSTKFHYGQFLIRFASKHSHNQSLSNF